MTSVCGIFGILVVINHFLEGRGHIVHDKMSNVLRSFGYNNSVLLQEKKKKSVKKFKFSYEVQKTNCTILMLPSLTISRILMYH